MKRTVIAIVGLLLLFPVFETKAQKLEDFFYGDTLVVNGDSLPYLMYNPIGQHDTSRLPLVIFLHGSGERGRDNHATLLHCIPFFMEETVRSQYAFRMIVPQCGSDDRWVDTEWNLSSHRMPKEPSRPMKVLFYLIDSLLATPNIDPDRIYAMGISMGGYGVWDMIQRRPDLCAAAVPICGGGDTTLAPTLTDISIWIFHGAEDPLVKPERSTQMYQCIRKAGGTKVYYDLYPDLGHICWNRPFEQAGVIPWLFRQRRTAVR